MNKHVAAMLTMLIIPSAFAQTPLTDSKTIVIKPALWPSRWCLILPIHLRKISWDDRSS